MVLKTLGLLTLMAQSGLLIPVEEGSEFTVFTDVISVIGDGQSLAQSLSTFSAQMKSIEGMLRDASKGCCCSLTSWRQVQTLVKESPSQSPFWKS